MKRLLIPLLLCLLSPSQAQETITVDAQAKGTPFPHFWEQMFGSGRAILALREGYRNDVRAVKQVADFRYVRFHAILHDEVGVYNEDEHGNPVYNFSYVDAIYDGLLHLGVRPVVEISFMPKKLAFNPDAGHPFWYKPIVSAPKSMEKWDGLMRALATHLIERYGIDEVAQWYFEVWNEPNLDFFQAVPQERVYFDLYDHTARALKGVNPRLRVGGPATSAAHWIDDFLKYVAEHQSPIDFVSTHGYADDSAEEMIGEPETVPQDERVCRAIKKVRGEINASSHPKLPLFWTEWNVQGLNESRDTTFVGPALANTVRQCDGNVDMMSFWTFSDVFEEGGPPSTPFTGAFGLRAMGGINKPSYYGFGLLHQLGNTRLPVQSEDAIATKTAEGKIAVALWNLVDPDKHGGPKTVTVQFRGVAPNAQVSIQRVDETHGNVLPRYAAMGKPKIPTLEQIERLNRDTALPAPERMRLGSGSLRLQLTANALVLVTVE